MVREIVKKAVCCPLVSQLDMPASMLAIVFEGIEVPFSPNCGLVTLA